jgi:hypothetical protein
MYTLQGRLWAVPEPEAGLRVPISSSKHWVLVRHVTLLGSLSTWIDFAEQVDESLCLGGFSCAGDCRAG